MHSKPWFRSALGLSLNSCHGLFKLHCFCLLQASLGQHFLYRGSPGQAPKIVQA